MTKLRGNPWAVLVVVSLGFFMTLLDKTFTGAKNIIFTVMARDVANVLVRIPDGRTDSSTRQFGA